jgi:predicted aspartyl protease
MSSKVYRAQAYQNLWVVQAVAGSELIQPSLVRLLVDTGSSYTVLPSNAFTSGLLGMDFMQRFGIVIDTAKGELRF